MIRRLREEEAVYAIENGEFAESVVSQARHSALVLTQSWCPQWHFLQSYLHKAEKELQKDYADSCAILIMEYDKSSIFQEFMHFKETVFGNRTIPYIRYYTDGVLFTESNFISAQGFRDRLLAIKK